MDRLVQSSQQAKAEGKEKSSFPFWIVAVIVGVLFIIGLLLIIVIIAVVIMRRRKGKEAESGCSGYRKELSHARPGGAFAFAKLRETASPPPALSQAIKG